MRRRDVMQSSARRWAAAAAVVIGTMVGAGALGAQDCPPPPQQARAEVETETRVAVARLARVTGGDLSVRTRQTVRDLLTRLPDANRVYLEQMLFAAYCSAVRDDRSLTATQRAERLDRYARAVRTALYPPSPPPDPAVRGRAGRPSAVGEDAAARKRRRAADSLAGEGISAADTAAFFRALAARDAGTVRLFLASGLSPNVTTSADPARPSALAEAAATGDSALVALLLAAGARVDRPSGSGRTPIFRAVLARSAPTVRLLLARGADPGHVAKDGATTLHWAVEDGDTAVTALLLGALPELRRRALWSVDWREYFLTPLALAVREQHIAAARLLLRAGAPADEPAGKPPLCQVAERAGINTFSGTVTLRSYRARQLELARLLVEEGGARPDPPCTGHSVLTEPTRAGDTTLVGYLVSRGADPNRSWSDEGPPLWAVTRRCGPGTTIEDLAGARLLVSRGARGEWQDPSDRRTLLMRAAGSPACADLLLAAGADPRARDRDGRTPLHYAASAWSAPVIARLLARGADPRATATDGATPLMTLVGAEDDASRDVDSLEALDLLLRAGANPDARRADGMTVRDLAVRRGHCRVAARLGGACPAGPVGRR